MGWSLWSSDAGRGSQTKDVSAPQTAEENNFTGDKSPSSSYTPSSTSSSSSDSTPTRPSPRPLTRDEEAERDFYALLNSLDTSTPTSTPTSTTSQATATDNSTTRTNIPASFDPSSQSLYPTTMSCTSSFDQAVYCYSVGGQFLNVYRYGTLRDCSHLWSQFWFCMRTRSYPAEERAEMVQAFYKKRDAARYKQAGSSEDVWESR